MEKKRKRKAILLLAYIADVRCLINRSFYMRTLSLNDDFIVVCKNGGVTSLLGI